MAKDSIIKPIIIKGSTADIMRALYGAADDRLVKRDAIAASAYAGRQSLNEANHTNNSIQHLLPYVTITDRSVVANYQTEAMEYENKIRDLTARNSELEQLYDALKKNHAACQSLLKQDNKIPLADFQILDSITTKFIKKVGEFNAALASITKSQDALYDRLEKVTPIAQRVEAPKRPDDQAPTRRSFGS